MHGLPLRTGWWHLATRGRGQMRGHKVPQGQELAFGVQQHLCICGGDDRRNGQLSPSGGAGQGRAGKARWMGRAAHREPSHTV